MSNTLPKLLKDISEKYPESAAQYSKDENKKFQPTSFKDFFIEEYYLRGTLFVIDIFWKLQFLNHFIS